MQWRSTKPGIFARVAKIFARVAKIFARIAKISQP